MKKSALSRTTGRKNRGGTLIGIFVGLVLGMVISFGLVWYMQKMPLPFHDKSARPERSATGDANPAPLPGKPGDKVAERPRFEFYKILPGGQESPAESPAADNKTAGAKPAENKPAETKPTETKPADTGKTPPPAGEPVYLQAGAFQKAEDADTLKAKLALMGIEANIIDADVPDKGRVHRVRVGPFANGDEAARVRAQLAQSGITANPTKNR